MSKRTVIVSGGMLEEDFVLPILKDEDTEFIIGVDRGLVFLYDHGIKPDYIVGDFDRHAGKTCGILPGRSKCAHTGIQPR